jgi:hypothetical protein
MQDNTAKNTVPFPNKKGMPKDIHGSMTVTPHLFSPMVEKFLVPAAWFAGGIVFAKIFLGKKASL